MYLCMCVSIYVSRLVIFCGEVVTTSLLERCLHTLPWIRFINLYSVSESHDMTCGDLNEWSNQLKVVNHTGVIPLHL